MTGTAANATSASWPSVATSITVTPASEPTATMAWASPVCRKLDRVSMSVVMRVMILPDRRDSK